jgi:hypothetical protein
MLKPVIRQLMKCEDLEISVFAMNTAAAELFDINVRLLQYSDFFGDNKDVVRYGETCLDKLDKVVDKRESIYYLGVGFLDLVQRYGEEAAATMYENSGGRYVFEPVGAMRTVLEIEEPDLLVTTNSPRTEKAAGLAAAEMGIPHVAFIDMFGIRCSSWFKDGKFANRILVLSDSVKRYYTQLGRRDDELVVTGNPAFDELSRYYAVNRSEIRAVRVQSRYKVLWASQPEPEYLAELDKYGNPAFPLEAEKVLLEAYERAGGRWDLVCRNHPSEVPRTYPRGVLRSEQSDDLARLLSTVHVVLTPSSTVGFQGVILGANLITLNASVLTPTMPYAEMGYSMGLQTLGEIERALEYFEDPANRHAEPAYSETDATGKAVIEIRKLLSR